MAYKILGDFCAKTNDFYTKSLTFALIYDILIPVHVNLMLGF